ncbi:lysylphosphatidylglycerol synthase transmembrane domain-containing protein [Azospirillum argentinense]|nr:lysylphosphatidylglycerol synthase transmembrane domain-containing protein [Azospirillum argentinense]
MMKSLAKIGITIALIVVVALRAGVWDALDRVLSLLPSVLLASAALYLLALAVQSVKLRVLLPECPFSLLFRVTMLGQFYGLVLFGQVGGDIARTVCLARACDDPHKVVAASLFDRITGLIGLLILTMASLWLETDHFSPGLRLTMAFLCGGIGLALAALLLPLHRLLAPVLARLPFADRWSGHLERVRTALTTFVARPRLAMLSILWGVVFQAMVVAICAVLGAGIGIDLPPTVWAVVMGVLSLVLLAPVSVGGVGLRDVTLVGMLAGFGVSADAAFALSLTLLGLQLLGGAIGGVLSLMPPAAPQAAPSSNCPPSH